MMQIKKLSLNHAVCMTILKGWNMSMQKTEQIFLMTEVSFFIVYGQHYKKNDKFYNVQYMIQIRPFDDNREYAYIFS